MRHLIDDTLPHVLTRSFVRWQTDTVLESNMRFRPTIDTWKRTSGTRDRPYDVAVIDVSSSGVSDGVVVVHDVFDKTAFTRKQTTNENRIHITINDIQVDENVDWYLLTLMLKRRPVVVFTHGSVAGLIGDRCIAVRGKIVRESLRFDIGTVLWQELSRHIGTGTDPADTPPPPAGPRTSPPRPMRTSVQSFDRMFDEMYELDSSFDPAAPNRANPANLANVPPAVVNQVSPNQAWPGGRVEFSNCTHITFNFITKRCCDD